jgi:hypothetical protein
MISSSFSASLQLASSFNTSLIVEGVLFPIPLVVGLILFFYTRRHKLSALCCRGQLQQDREDPTAGPGPVSDDSSSAPIHSPYVLMRSDSHGQQSNDLVSPSVLESPDSPSDSNLTSRSVFSYNPVSFVSTNGNAPQTVPLHQLI